MSEKAMLIGEINQIVRYMPKRELEATGLSGRLIHDLRSGTLERYSAHELVVLLDRLERANAPESPSESAQPAPGA